MSPLKRFILSLLGFNFPTHICEQYNGYYKCLNKKYAVVYMSQRAFDYLITSGYYEEDNFDTSEKWYKLIS